VRQGERALVHRGGRELQGLPDVVIGKFQPLGRPAPDA
jgi:hypothetical protein